ncbi:MAG: zf-HC2 domain-containing protein [Desulfurivibrionaceae bacterium]
MLTCLGYRNRLGAYLDSELSPRWSKAVSAHLARCKNCRIALEELRRLAPAMHALEVPPVPANLADQVMARARTRPVLSDEEPVMWSPLEWWRMRSAPLRLAACATVLFAFLLGLTLGRGDFSFRNNQASVAGAASVEGFEWFGQTPPASLGSTYLMLASNEVGDMNR